MEIMQKMKLLDSRVYQVPKPDNVSIDGQANLAVLKRFGEIYPNLLPYSSQGIKLEGPAYEAGILMQIAGGTAPDAIYVNFRQSGTYIEKGFLQPLDDFIDVSMTAAGSQGKRGF